MKVDSDLERSIRVLLSDAVNLLHAVVFSTLQATPEIPPSVDQTHLEEPQLVNLGWSADNVNVRVDGYGRQFLKARSPESSWT